MNADAAKSYMQAIAEDKKAKAGRHEGEYVRMLREVVGAVHKPAAVAWDVGIMTHMEAAARARVVVVVSDPPALLKSVSVPEKTTGGY